ncbi:MAG: DUF3817 domain-containing protein [Bdellovibrionales bacterium]|nr:DUF3817 domain-containing protein [Bdellovibrionales bacterium]
MTPELFRTVGFVEALSLLLLLFVAMPLKYIGGYPQAVSVVGMVHGVLFLAYASLGMLLLDELGWGYRRLALACCIASIPFGPFLFDRVLFPKRQAALE